MAKNKVKNEKVFLGAFVDRQMKDDLKKVAKRERRSLNAQVELFLALGVQHLKTKEAA